MRTLNRHLVLMSNVDGGFSDLRPVVATTGTVVTIELVPLILVPNDK